MLLKRTYLCFDGALCLESPGATLGRLGRPGMDRSESGLCAANKQEAQNPICALMLATTVCEAARACTAFILRRLPACRTSGMTRGQGGPALRVLAFCLTYLFFRACMLAVY